MNVRHVSFCALLSFACLVMCGCEPDTHPTTPAELKAFKGGPMPPDIAKKWGEEMRQNAQKSAASRAKLQGQAPAAGK